MLLGIVLSIASIIGILYGFINKKRLLGIVSVILLILIVAVWIYFYNNPY
jgi:hypothetical protein